jgi:hypothetical protein
MELKLQQINMRLLKAKHSKKLFINKYKFKNCSVGITTLDNEYCLIVKFSSNTKKLLPKTINGTKIIYKFNTGKIKTLKKD